MSCHNGKLHFSWTLHSKPKANMFAQSELKNGIKRIQCTKVTLCGIYIYINSRCIASILYFQKISFFILCLNIFFFLRLGFLTFLGVHDNHRDARLIPYRCIWLPGNNLKVFFLVCKQRLQFYLSTKFLLYIINSIFLSNILMANSFSFLSVFGKIGYICLGWCYASISQSILWFLVSWEQCNCK